MRRDVDAVVNAMPVRDGDAVEAGAVLLTLDDRDAQLALKQSDADLKEAQAQFRFAKIRLNRSRQAFNKEKQLLTITNDRSARAEEIFGEGLLSRADLDTATENLARQQLAVNQAELSVDENATKLIELEARIAKLTALRDRAALDLDRTTIKAPFPGVISEVQVSEGDRVRTGDMLMRLQNPESVEIRAQLPSRFAQSITDYLSSHETIAATVEIEGRKAQGQVLRVSGQTRSGTGGVDSFIGFNSAINGLRLGSTVRVLLDLPPENNVIALPGEALYGRDKIYKLVGDRMEMIEIERVGERENLDGSTQVLVRAPALNTEDQIITTKLANASNGLLVRRNLIEPTIDDPQSRTANLTRRTAAN